MDTKNIQKTYEYIGTTDALYMNGRWNEKVDFWKCHKCNGDFWSIPTVQKCLRIEQKCPKCDKEKDFTWWHYLWNNVIKYFSKIKFKLFK